MTQLWATTDYTPRNSQDSNSMYTSNSLTLPHYTNNNDVNYLNSDGIRHYPAMSPSYAPYSSPFVPSQHATGPLMYMQPSGAVSMPYQLQPPSSATLPSQPRSKPKHSCCSPIQNHRVAHHHARLPLAPEVCLTDTEDQESPNHETMQSEPMNPPLDGYPNVDDFDNLMKQYVENLSPKKQDKALIHAKRAANIKAVLIDKKTTAIESAQFRFWVKKMFTLEPRDPSIAARKKKICHEGKPVAIREKLFKILTRAHRQCEHGGRDKTSAQVRRVYSWVPKELISRFVKLCPTCQVRRGTNRTSPSASENSPRTFLDPHSPELSSSNQPCRHSITMGANPCVQSPLQMSKCSSTFQQQNRWMTPLHSAGKAIDPVATLEAAASAMMDGNMNMNMNGSVSPVKFEPAPLKWADDPGTPLMPPITIQGRSMSPDYHHVDYNGGQSMQNTHHDSHPYRLKRSSVFKREQPY